MVSFSPSLPKPQQIIPSPPFVKAPEMMGKNQVIVWPKCWLEKTKGAAHTKGYSVDLKSKSSVSHRRVNYPLFKNLSWERSAPKIWTIKMWVRTGSGVPSVPQWNSTFWVGGQISTCGILLVILPDYSFWCRWLWDLYQIFWNFLKRCQKCHFWSLSVKKVLIWWHHLWRGEVYPKRSWPGSMAFMTGDGMSEP